MREIKFRAWDTCSKRMIDWYDATFLNLNSEGRNTTTSMLCEYPLRHVNSETNFFIYMQYTGLKDKNGVEIYEGDIVSGVLYKDYSEHIGYVKYDYNGYMIVTKEKSVSLSLTELLTVIGNIHQNPELLEAK